MVLYYLYTSSYIICYIDLTEVENNTQKINGYCKLKVLWWLIPFKKFSKTHTVRIFTLSFVPMNSAYCQQETKASFTCHFIQ